MRVRHPVVIALALLAFGARAEAAPTDDERARATALFKEAKTLLAEEKVAEACRKLEESQRLDPLPGTLLNLAVCHEREGRLATASAELQEARTLAVRDQRDDRVALADEHLRAIASKISYLVVVVEPTAPPDLRIARDGTLLARGEWGTRLPVDPGEHVVDAAAAGHKPSRHLVKVGPEGDVQSFALPPLEAEPPPPVATPPPPPIAVTPAEAPLSTRRKAALGIAGAGGVALGLGSYFGLRAFDKHDDPGAVCRTTPCSGTSLALNDDAKVAADVSTVAFVVGIVAIAGAAVLWFTGR